MQSCDGHHKHATIPRRAHEISRKRVFGFVWLTNGITIQLTVVLDTRLYIIRALRCNFRFVPHLWRIDQDFLSILEGGGDLAVCEPRMSRSWPHPRPP